MREGKNIKRENVGGFGWSGWASALQPYGHMARG